MSSSVWIPGPLPGQNEIIAAAKGAGGRGYLYAKLKREWTERIAWLAKSARTPRMTGPVVLAFEWREASRRRDPDNFVGGGRKLVLDGLVQAGVLEDDGWKQVAGFTDTWKVAGDPGVMVTLTLAGERAQTAY